MYAGQELCPGLDRAALPCFQTGVVVTGGTAAKHSLEAQKAFSTETTIVKETSVKLWTGHLEVQTS